MRANQNRASFSGASATEKRCATPATTTSKSPPSNYINIHIYTFETYKIGVIQSFIHYQ